MSGPFSRSGHFISGERTFRTYWKQDWVGVRSRSRREDKVPTHLLVLETRPSKQSPYWQGYHGSFL
jgi:hypothetical protein